MKEFGSDFHFLTDYQSQRAHLTDVHRDAVLMADGRQCIVALIRQEGWRRIWMPEYFCYEVIETIKVQTRIEVLFYSDYPLQKDDAAIKRCQGTGQWHYKHHSCDFSFLQLIGYRKGYAT